MKGSWISCDMKKLNTFSTKAPIHTSETKMYTCP